MGFLAQVIIGAVIAIYSTTLTTIIVSDIMERSEWNKIKCDIDNERQELVCIENKHTITKTYHPIPIVNATR